MNRTPALACLLATIAASACAPTAGIHPQARLMGSTTLRPGAAIDSLERRTDWPRARWWQVLGDPQLDAFVEEAAANRPDLDAARARLAGAQAEAEVAGAARQPQVGLDAELGRQRYARNTTASPPGGYTVWSNTVGTDFSLDLDLWGRHRAELRAALGSVHANEAEFQAVRIAIELAVVRAYVQLWAQYRLLDAYTRLHDQALRARDIAAKRNQAGIASALDLAQADTVVATSGSDLEQVHHDIASLRNELGYLSGKGPGRGDTLVRPALSIDEGTLLPRTLPVELLGHRPDIVARRWQVEVAAQHIDVARTAFYPNIDLVGIATMGSLSRASGFFNFLSKESAGHRVGLALSLPLFDGGQRRGEYGVAVASYDGAVDEYNTTVIDALGEVADGVTDLRALDRQVRQAQLANASANLAYRLARDGYRGGITEFLNVLSAQDLQAHQQQLLIVTQARELDAWARLMHALGGGAPALERAPDSPAA